jgi:hypothetical protein
MDLTTTDKVMIGGGVALVIGGGVLWYVNSKKNKQEELAGGQAYVDKEPVGKTTQTTTSEPKKLPAGTTPAQQKAIEQITGRQPDKVRFYKGDILIANSENGVKTYKVERLSFNTYKNTGSVAAVFKRGDEIGEVIWVGDNKDGTFRYVCERDGIILNSLYWITDASVVLKKATKSTKAAIQHQLGSSIPLNHNLLLQKGSKGKEVEVLQKNLGFITMAEREKIVIPSNVKRIMPNVIDGDFGQKTEDALFKKHGVKSIKLSQLK